MRHHRGRYSNCASLTYVYHRPTVVYRGLPVNSESQHHRRYRRRWPNSPQSARYETDPATTFMNFIMQPRALLLRCYAMHGTKTIQSTAAAKILRLLTLNGSRKMESPLLPGIPARCFAEVCDENIKDFFLKSNLIVFRKIITADFWEDWLFFFHITFG